jgi:hypothetical protein
MPFADVLREVRDGCAAHGAFYAAAAALAVATTTTAAAAEAAALEASTAATATVAAATTVAAASTATTGATLFEFFSVSRLRHILLTHQFTPNNPRAMTAVTLGIFSKTWTRLQ